MRQGDTNSIPGLGRFFGGGNGNPLQCSCLGYPTNRAASGGATVRGVTKSQTRLSDGADTQLTSDWASVCRKANFLSSGSIQHIRKPGGHTEISAKYKKKTIQIFSPSVGKNPFLRRTYFPIVDKSEESAARPHSRRGRKWSSQPTSRPGIWEQSLEGWRLSWRSRCPPQGRREQAGT